MFHYVMTLDGESVGIRSTVDLTPLFVHWAASAHLRNVTIGQGANCEFNINFTETAGNLAEYLPTTVNINATLKTLGMGEFLLYAALPFFEVLHQRQMMVTMHAAAVEIHGRAVLLLGNVGAGKTSITLSLCQNNSGNLIGNDIVKVRLVGRSVLACFGSKYFFLRQESIRRNLPDLLPLFPASNTDPWLHKIYCVPETLGIRVAANHIPIARTYLVHVDETMKTLHATAADTRDTRLYLNENMSRYIRSTAVSLFTDRSRLMAYVPPFDNPSFFTMRALLLEAMISSTHITYVAGNLRDTCDRIISDLGGSGDLGESSVSHV